MNLKNIASPRPRRGELENQTAEAAKPGRHPSTKLARAAGGQGTAGEPARGGEGPGTARSRRAHFLPAPGSGGARRAVTCGAI